MLHMPQNSLDTTVDIETTGTSPGCCILSIGAASTCGKFTFYQNIWHAPQKTDYGLKDDAETLAWWDKQGKGARDEAFSGTMGLATALGNYSDWLRSLPANKVFVWGNGADFDNAILSYAYKAVGMKNPFGFNNRCYRTLKNLYPDIKAGEFMGIKHHALADAIHEAQHLAQLLRYHFRREHPVFQD